MKDAIRWRMVRLPADLADRLDAMGDAMHRAHVEGRAQLPAEYVERVPIHHVIDKALSEMEAHKARSNAPKRSKAAT